MTDPVYVKITDLTALNAIPASTDMLEIVDVSNTEDSAEGSTRRVTVEQLTSIPASRVVSGVFPDGRISQTAVTQHQAALAVTADQISDAGAFGLSWLQLSTLEQALAAIVHTHAHSALVGLSADDHPQYALANGSRGNFAPTSHTHAHSALTGVVANQHIDHSLVSITAGAGLSGGGNITTSRTLAVNINGLTEDPTPDSANDFLVIHDSSANALRKVRLSTVVAGGSGTVTGSGTDHQMVRFDGTGAIQDMPGWSGSDAGKLTGRSSAFPAATATDGATVTFDLNAANFHEVTITDDRILALTNATVGQNFTVAIKQGTGGNHSVTWWDTILWPNGIEPTLTITEGKVDEFVFRIIGTDGYGNPICRGHVTGLNFSG